MEISCLLRKVIGGSCGHNRKDRTQSTTVISLQACNKEIAAHKSTFQFSGIESELDLILSWAGIFTLPDDIHCWTVCPLHRSKLELGWSRGNNARCRVPTVLSNHRQGKGKWPKCDRGICKDDSQLILKNTGIFLQIGSGKNNLMFFYLICVDNVIAYFSIDLEFFCDFIQVFVQYVVRSWKH